MAYTDIDNPELYFQTKIFTGNENTLAVTFDGSENMQPDWVWIKNRADTYNHSLFDSVRGATKRIASNATLAEATVAASLTAFNSNGFTLGNDTTSNAPNNSHVSWNWKAGTSFTNDASATGIGSIDSTGSVNTDAGFSIVTFTGNSGSIAHGLAQKPAMVIIKPRNVSGSWIVTHKGLGAEMQDYYLFLDTTAAKATSNDIWGGEPTSTTFSVSSSLIDSANYVAYCFAEKKGYSKFGSYTGNGNADGTFVYTGFKPAWVMVKPTDAADNWVMFDNKRLGFNSSTSPYNFYANKAFAETTDTGQLDLLSNGFKIRNSGNTVNRTSTFIYMAFAENPFVTSTGVPATAR